MRELLKEARRLVRLSSLRTPEGLRWGGGGGVGSSGEVQDVGCVVAEAGDIGLRKVSLLVVCGSA